jgi:hypothetical protein
LWSQVVATSGSWQQMELRRKRLNDAETAAAGCDRLPQESHGKECDEEGPPRPAGSGLSAGSYREEARVQCCTPVLDLSRRRLDFHLLDEGGATVEVGAAPPDADGLHS